MDTNITTADQENTYETPDPMRLARRGKIARLPRRSREQINHRLANGESATTILAWLNADPEVEHLLDIEFDGNPMTPGNLSEWRQGGFREWEQQQAACERLRALGDRAGQYQGAAEGRLGEQLTQVFALELWNTLEQVLAETTSVKERWACLREGLREIRLLRGGDHSAGRLALAETQWVSRERAAAEAERKAEAAARKQEFITELTATAMGVDEAALFGGGERGRWLAEITRRVRRDEPFDDLLKAAPLRKAAANTQNGCEKRVENQGNTTKSDQIQPPPKNGQPTSPMSRPLTRREALAQLGSAQPQPPLNIRPAKSSLPAASPRPPETKKS